jgi:hypothetical protein
VPTRSASRDAAATAASAGKGPSRCAVPSSTWASAYGATTRAPAPNDRQLRERGKPGRVIVCGLARRLRTEGTTTIWWTVSPASRPDSHSSSRPKASWRSRRSRGNDCVGVQIAEVPPSWPARRHRVNPGSTLTDSLQHPLAREMAGGKRRVDGRVDRLWRDSCKHANLRRKDCHQRSTSSIASNGTVAGGMTMRIDGLRVYR